MVTFIEMNRADEIFPPMGGASVRIEKTAPREYRTYLSGATGEVPLPLVACDEYTASEIKREVEQITQPKGRHGHPHIHKRYKLHLNDECKHSVRLAWLACDETRAARYIETCYALNIMLRGVGLLYDDMIDLFDGINSQAIKQMYVDAEKAVAKVLDAAQTALCIDEEKTMLVNDKGRTKNDQTQHTFECLAQWLIERVILLIPHATIFADKSGDWRLSEFDKKLEDIMPSELLEKQRKTAAEGFKKIILAEIEKATAK